MALDVKYLRGTAAQYQAYLDADKIASTTYYLIYPETVGEGTPVLYIGTVLLSESEAINTIAAKVAENESTIIAMESDISTLEADVTNLKENAGHKFYETTELPAFEEGHSYKEGDVCIVTVTSEGIDFKTAYHCVTIDGALVWKAMAGNYNAANVYYDKNIQVTQTVGNIETSNNTPVDLEFKGKNMEQIWQYLYATEDLELSITQPSVSMSVSGSTSKEVGNTFSDPVVKITFADGSYEYGSKDESGVSYTKADGAGVLWSAAEIKDSEGNVLATKTESSNSALQVTFDVEDNVIHEGSVTYSFTGKASCPASVRKPVTNLGNFINSNGEAVTAYVDGTKQTAAVTDKVLSASATITGWRGCFWGYKTSKELDPTALTSTQIRALGNGPSQSLGTISKSLTKMQQIFVAFPANKYTSVTVTNTDLGAAQTVKKVTGVQVEGYNGYEAADYDVYYVSNDNADSKAYNYSIVVK